MKNMEVLHTLRLYDADFIAKLGTLLEQEKSCYRNKNEFLTAILKQGYASYATAAKKANAGAALMNTESTAKEKTSAATAPAESGKELYALITEMNRYMTLQLKTISLYQEIQQRLLSSIYRITLSLAGGERIIPTNIEAGFFDDLPLRFEKIIFNLKKEYGLL